MEEGKDRGKGNHRDRRDRKVDHDRYVLLHLDH